MLLCRNYYSNRRCLENYFILMMLFGWTKYNFKFIKCHQKLSGRCPISKAVPRLDYQLFGVSTFFSRKTQGRYKLDSLKWQEIQPRLCLEKIIPAPSIMFCAKTKISLTPTSASPGQGILPRASVNI